MLRETSYLSAFQRVKKTASRARDIQFSGAPQALRSEARPEGVDGSVKQTSFTKRHSNSSPFALNMANIFLVRIP